MTPSREQFFESNYTALREQPPMLWMRRLFLKLADGWHPTLVDLPTGTGKTDVIIIWILVLAWYGSQKATNTPVPRRLVWVVNRRVLVQQVFRLADRLLDEAILFGSQRKRKQGRGAEARRRDGTDGPERAVREAHAKSSIRRRREITCSERVLLTSGGCCEESQVSQPMNMRVPPQLFEDPDAGMMLAQIAEKVLGRGPITAFGRIAHGGGHRLNGGEEHLGQGMHEWEANPLHEWDGGVGRTSGATAISPDGKWFAYTSDESGSGEIYVRPFPSRQGKWTVSVGGGKFPVWSRASKDLYFSTLDNQVMVAPYSVNGREFAAGRPTPWSELRLRGTGAAPNFDVSPDGKQVLVAPKTQAPSAGNQVRVMFLLNFSDEVKRRIP